MERPDRLLRPSETCQVCWVQAGRLRSQEDDSLGVCTELSTDLGERIERIVSVRGKAVIQVCLVVNEFG
jgi:hypothetical protein